MLSHSCTQLRRKVHKLFPVFIVVLLFLLGMQTGARADFVTGTVVTGTHPCATAVNPVTNQIYVANQGDGSVTVINGATNRAETINLVSAGNLCAIAVNPVTNKVYAIDQSDPGKVFVIDGRTKAVQAVAVQTNPVAVAINSVTNKVYVVNTSNSVTVIDGATNQTQTIIVGSTPSAIAVNPVTNKIYVANFGGNSLTVIDGATNQTKDIAVGVYPTVIAVNPATNKVYIGYRMRASVDVLDGISEQLQTVQTGQDPIIPKGVVVNPVTNMIYFTTQYAFLVAINGENNQVTTINTGSYNENIALNPMTNKIYVTLKNSSFVTVIDGTTNTADYEAISIDDYAKSVAVNPITGKVYILGADRNCVTVADGADFAEDTDHYIFGGAVLTGGVAINPINNDVYIADYDTDSIITIDGSTGAYSIQYSGSHPSAAVVNPTTNQIFVANFGENTVTIVDGSTHTNIGIVNVGSNPVALAVNPIANKVYVANYDGQSITVIDGITHATTTIQLPADCNPAAIAVNPYTNKIFVANSWGDSVTVIDGATNTIINTLSTGSYSHPIAVVVNPVTNKVYTANYSSNTVSVIDGDNLSIHPITVGNGPSVIDLNPTTNMIYVANTTDGSVSAINGTTEAVSPVTAGSYPIGITVDRATNRIFVANRDGNSLTVIDGATNTKIDIANQHLIAPMVVAVNPVNGKIYIANASGSHGVTVLDSQKSQNIPLIPEIQTPDIQNQFSFTMKGISTFTPNQTTANGLYFQLDTTTGKWNSAESDTDHGLFMDWLTSAWQGPHILYVFVTDGQETASVNATGILTGKVVAYFFEVPTAPEMDSATDNGPSNVDRITNFGQPMFKGQTLPTSLVNIYLDNQETPFDSVSATAFGEWTWTPTSDLPEGYHSIQLLVTEPQGLQLPSEPISFTIDRTAPTINKVERIDNTHIKVTLSESCAGLSAANNGGFTVEAAGDPSTTYDVTSIHQGDSDRIVNLTVENISPSAAAGVTVKYAAGGTGVIEDIAGNNLTDPAAGLSTEGWQPYVSVNNVTVTEGTTATFTITLSKPSSEWIAVSYSTSAGTATLGTDFAGRSGTLLFAPGQTSKDVDITTNDDSLDEAEETFEFRLSNAVHTVIATPIGTGTIIDNDPAPNVSINDFTMTEGDNGSMNAVFTVTLSTASAQSVSVDYTTAAGTATANVDYTSVSGTVTFEPGFTTRIISVPVIGDLTIESDETFNVNLSNAVNAVVMDSQGVGTIIDNDQTPGLSINDVTVTEGDSGYAYATFTVNLKPANAKTVTVKYATAAGTAKADVDYVSKSGTLTFAPGETSKTVTVAVNGDLRNEGNETFYVKLAGAVNAPIADQQGIATIIDNDPQPTVKVSDFTITEGNLNAVFTVSLSAVSGKTVTVKYKTDAGTATDGTDYTGKSGVLTFTPGVKALTVSVPVKSDLLDEENETFTLNLSDAVNATINDGEGLGTITDNDPKPGITINDLTIVEGDSEPVNAVFTVKLSAASGQIVNVNYATAAGTAAADTDYTSVSGTLTFDPGVTTQTVTVPVIGDLTRESSESFKVNLSSAVNGSIMDSQGVCTIIDNESPYISINDTTVAEGDSGYAYATFTVTLAHASQKTVKVTYTTAPLSAKPTVDYITKSATLTFAPGETSKTVTITVKGDLLYEGDETFCVNLVSPINAPIADKQGIATITDNDPQPSIQINDVTVTESNSGYVNAVFTVRLSAVCGRTVTVNYATAAGTTTAGVDYVNKSGTLTFTPGVKALTVTVLVKPDLMDEEDETFTVNLSGAVNATIADDTGLGTIIDNDAKPNLTISDVTVTEGNSGSTNAVFTVKLSQASGKTITVDYATAANTATGEADYTPVSGTLTFNPGIKSLTVSVPVNGDLIDEANETFKVNLSNAVNAAILDGTGVGTIYDDDFAPKLAINDITVQEGNSGSTNAIFTVTLSAASEKTITVKYNTVAGTATSGTDFIAAAGTLTFAPGVTTQTITVSVQGDTITENDETFAVSLSSAVNASISDPAGVCKITNDDVSAG